MRTKHLLKPLHVRRSLRVLFFPCMEFLFRLLVPLVELGLYGKGYSFSDSGTIGCSFFCSFYVHKCGLGSCRLLDINVK